MSISTDDLRRLCETATPGPWRVREDEIVAPLDPDGHQDPIAVQVQPHDSEFIVAVRDALPALLDRYEHAEDSANLLNEALKETYAEAAHLRTALEKVRQTCCIWRPDKNGCLGDQCPGHLAAEALKTEILAAEVWAGRVVTEMEASDISPVPQDHLAVGRLIGKLPKLDSVDHLLLLDGEALCPGCRLPVAECNGSRAGCSKPKK